MMDEIMSAFPGEGNGSDRTDAHKRVIYLDIIRALAVVLIVFTHCWAQFVVNWDFLQRGHGWIQSLSGWLIWQIGHMPTRDGVPLFAMLTGALMLGREYPDIAAFLRKKLPKFIAATFICALIYWLLVRYCLDLGGRNLKHEFKAILLGNEPLGAYHLWYMYMAIGLYASIPFLARMLKNLNEKELSLLIGLALFLVVVPTTLNESHLGFNYFNSYAFIIQTYALYAILGYWLHQYNGLSNISIGIRICLILLLWAGVIVLKYYKLYPPTADWRSFTNISSYDSLYVFVSSVLVFSVIRDYFYQAEKLNGAIELVAMSAFSIYLWHLIAVHIGTYLYPRLELNAFFMVFLMLAGGLGVGIILYLALRNTKLSFLVK